MIKVSVIIPIYNAEKYVKKCLDSLILQKLKEIEIILVNDGSTDSSENIINEYAKKYKNIKIFNKTNGGVSSARNYGIRVAKGEYISFIDSDDYIDPRMLKDMYDKLSKESLDILVCDHYKVFENSDKKIETCMKSTYSIDPVKKYIISSPAVWCRMFRRTLFNNIKFNESLSYCEDLLLVLMMVAKTTKIGFIEKPYYYYLQRQSSLMHQKEFELSQLDVFESLMQIKGYYIKNDIYDKYKEEIEYIYITHLLRTSTLRFLKFKNVNKYLNKINNTMKTIFPNWKENIYFKKSSYKLKLICYLAYKKQYWLLKIIDKKRHI